MPAMTGTDAPRPFLIASVAATLLCVLGAVSTPAALAAPGTSPGAAVGEPQPIGRFRDWGAFQIEETGGGRSCWMATRPTRAEGNYAKRGEVFLLVALRPHKGELDVITVHAGYDYAPGTDVTVQVDGRSFTLFTDGSTAWTRTEAADRELSKAIRSGGSLTVRGTSVRGTRTTDTFSLAGSGAAYEAAAKACGITPG